MGGRGEGGNGEKGWTYPNTDDVTLLDARVDDGVVRGRQDVREVEGLLVRYAVRDGEAVYVSEWYLNKESHG